MKFLTVFFLLIYIISLLGIKDEHYKNLSKPFDGKSSGYFIESLENMSNDAMPLFVLGLASLVTTIIEIFFIFFAIQYCNLYIGISFIILYFIRIIFMRKSKEIINKDKIIDINKIKPTIAERCIYLIYLAYYLYMFYILFIK